MHGTKYQTTIVYDPRAGAVVGCAWVTTPQGARLPVMARVKVRPLAERLAPVFLEQARKRSGVEASGVGFFSFAKKAWNAAWSKARKVAKAVGVVKIARKLRDGAKSVMRAAKKVLMDPRFAAAVGVAALVVPGAGPVMAAGYAATRAAIAVADGVTKGDPAALATLGKYVAQETPGAQQAAALVQTFAQQTQAAAAQVAQTANQIQQAARPA